MNILNNLRFLYEKIDELLTTWLAEHGIMLLRVSLGINFFWFGVLKFFPGLSQAEGLATDTIEMLTFGFVPPTVAIAVLALWECFIGIGLLTGMFMRATLFLLFVQMLGTFTPILFFPDEVFTRFPYALTLEGQYIIKNLVLISAGLVIGATVRGGAVIPDPKLVDTARQQAINEKYPFGVPPSLQKTATSTQQSRPVIIITTLLALMVIGAMGWYVYELLA